MRLRFARFLLSGVVNSISGWAVIFASLAYGLSGVLANGAGYIVGLLLSFTLNRYYVFGRRGRISKKEIARFLTTFIIAYMVNVSVLLIIQYVRPASKMLAQVPAIAAYCLVFFVLSQKFVFKHGGAE